MELEGPLRRIFDAIDDSDPVYGENHGSAEKWTDSKHMEGEPLGLVIYGLYRTREREGSSLPHISRLSSWVYSK